MVNENSQKGQVIAAILAASIILLIFSFLYNTIEARLDTSSSTSLITQELVDRLPMQIGSWSGQDIPIDENIIRFTGTDAHISRRYSRNRDFESVSLYVPCGTNARALAAHRPEVCYVAAGKMLTSSRSEELKLDNGTVLPFTIFTFSVGGLNIDEVLVLNYFLIDGQYCGNYSLLQSRAWRGSDTVDYVAQVQITVSITATVKEDAATKIATDFAADSAAYIAGLFEDIKDDKLLIKNEESSNK